MNDEEREIYIKKLTLTAVGVYIISIVLWVLTEQWQHRLSNNKPSNLTMAST